MTAFNDSTPIAQSGLTPERVLEYFSKHPNSQPLIDGFHVVLRLAERAAELGGRMFLVGGAVRDELLDQLPKDFDIELHGLSLDQTTALLKEFGVAQATGKSFGTFKLRSGLGGVEVALPRRDSQHGPKHTDVEVEVLPHLGLTEAARRREYTIGAIYKDVLTGALYDPFHGIEDLRTRILRLVDAVKFRDDALRVLRGVRQAARFSLTVESSTLAAMQTMVEALGFLPKDRLREEWLLLLTEPEHPSVAVDLLHQLGVLHRWHPELDQLWQTPQDIERHPEGSVGEHTLLVINAAASLARHYLPDLHRQQEFLLASLVHDLGKPLTTAQASGRLSAHGHEAAGARPAEVFLQSIGISEAAIHRIVSLVTHHAIPAAMYRDRQSISDRALRLLAREIGPTQLWPVVLLAEADHQGRGPYVMDDGQTRYPETTAYHQWWQENITRLQLDIQPEPLISGRELIVDRGASGWRQGQLIGQAQHLIEELRIVGKSREEILAILDRCASPAEALSALQGLLDREA